MANLTPIQIWLLAIRPKTLSAAVAPVLIGTAMAFRDGLAHLPSAMFALGGAVAIQIATNLTNDYFDYRKGADQPNRVGPLRVTQAGLVSPWAIILAFVLMFLIAVRMALPLIERGGEPIVVIAICSILSGILYTAGPRPLGYLGLGEIFVLIFFGPVAVAGTYYVQALEINPAVIAAGFGPGFLSTAILAVNNLRDIEGDRAAGKKTLAVRFGPSFARGEYCFAVLSAFLIPVLVYGMTQDYIHILATVALSYLAIPALQTVLTKTDGPSLNKALAYTGFLLLLYSLVFSAGFLYPFIIVALQQYK